MLPAAHFVVALLPVLAYVALRDRGLPAWSLVGVVFVGSLFPDFVDKPLAPGDDDITPPEANLREDARTSL